jgi:mannose-6-phosphate isomerase-like protein (cupin superfamily)
MDHTADLAQGHQTNIGYEESMEKGVAHIPPGKGRRSLWVLGELVTYKIPSQQTGGAYALFEVITRPGTGSPYHVQHREDESFYVVEGEFEFLSGEKTFRVGAGSLLYVPKGTLHSHKNVGGGMGRMLMSQTPGGLYERFFEDASKLIDGHSAQLILKDQPDVEKIVATGVRYGIEMPTLIAQSKRERT